jgi:hypothetical protein
MDNKDDKPRHPRTSKEVRVIMIIAAFTLLILGVIERQIQAHNYYEAFDPTTEPRRAALHTYGAV